MLIVHAASSSTNHVPPGGAELSFETDDLDSTASHLAGADPVISEPIRWDESCGEHLAIRDPSLVTAVGTATVFAELAASTIGAALGGGAYSVLVAAGASARIAIAIGFGLLVVVLAVAARSQFGGARRSRRTGMSSGTSG